ncbi:hypothetical protein HELRODRAFT_185664 [Helobdella robusta]|uniref:Apoptosis inhibitor 5 n=1 Tax=Helobdella robusta TaxID=6412 RepID=T1FN41_HELRO|nr:hypothetical protein HELRODRAFT_185664 [Helobdella robusta]ESO03060.1 hypothetical protein HELRODRAFT_185664 [Helobdella robusta]
MATIDDLYGYSAQLDGAKDKISQHTDVYKSILKGFEGTSNEKRLSSQLAAKYFKHFTQFAEETLESMFDLCEDSDVTVRKQAIKDLTVICKVTSKNCQKVADILVQLLQSSDNLEVSLVQMSLMSLLRLDTKATLAGVFGQIMLGDEVVREKAISFLVTKCKVMVSEEILSKDGAEEFLITQSKKVMEDVTGEEFVSFMKVLSSLPSLSSLQGRQQLLDIIADQIDLNAKVDVTDPDNLNCLMQCVEQASHLFSKNVHSNRFVQHMCLNVMPQVNDKSMPADMLLNVFKLLADMSVYCTSLNDADACVKCIYDHLITYMPQAPSNQTAGDTNNFPKFEFSYVECLMFAFHQLARLHRNFLTSDQHADRLKDFRARLQYFARGVQAYIKSLKSAQPTDSNHDVKKLALKTTMNINTLIKDLFHNPPSYKASITLSYKEDAAADQSDSNRQGLKRQAAPAVTTSSSSTSFSGVQSKRVRTEQARYAPPGGKFSRNPDLNRNVASSRKAW